MLGHCLRDAPEKKNVAFFSRSDKLFKVTVNFANRFYLGFAPGIAIKSPVDLDHHMLEFLLLKQLISCAYMIQAFG